MNETPVHTWNPSPENLMDAKYLIRKIETCPQCRGDKYLSNPHWQRICRDNAAWMDAHTGGRFTDEAEHDWKRRIEAQWPHQDPPPEEEPCYECEGEGKIETWIPLEQALVELG